MVGNWLGKSVFSFCRDIARSLFLWLFRLTYYALVVSVHLYRNLLYHPTFCNRAVAIFRWSCGVRYWINAIYGWTTLTIYNATRGSVRRRKKEFLDKLPRTIVKKQKRNTATTREWSLYQPDERFVYWCGCPHLFSRIARTTLSTVPTKSAIGTLFSRVAPCGIPIRRPDWKNCFRIRVKTCVKSCPASGTSTRIKAGISSPSLLMTMGAYLTMSNLLPCSW